MTFVIFSRRSLATSTTRTISLDFFIVLAGLVLLSVLGLGLFAGRMLLAPAHAPAKALVSELQAAQEPQDPQPVLIERIGELSARMVQLELEASGLAERMDAVKEFEQRMQIGKLPLGRAAKTPPASGGPLLKPVKPPAEPSPGVSVQSAQASHAVLTDIEHHIAQIAQLLTRLDQHAAHISLAHMSFPGRPPVLNGIRTSGFGNRADPFKKFQAFHSGIDFAGPVGTPVQASAGGTVVFSGVRKDYGNTVEIGHGAGLVTRYAHLSKLLVQTHQVVMPGQLIAKMGSTGRSTGSHLHFEVLKDGNFVNPDIYLKRF